MNLFALFDQMSQDQPNHPAIIGPGEAEPWSYRQLREQIEATAAEFSAAGIKAGDCVGVCIASGRSYIVSTYALWRCAACAVPIPLELAAEEKLEVCRKIHVDAVIATRKAAQTFGITPIQPPKPLAHDLALVFPETLAQHPPGYRQLNAAFIRFTSGTTGSSKGVVLSHETIRDRIYAANEALRIGPSDRVIWLLSMAYHFAVSIVSYLSFGATIVLCKDHFGATIFATTRQHGGTLIYGSPAHFDLMVNASSGLDLPSVRLFLSTTTALRDEIAEAFLCRFHQPLSQAYGIIEIGLPCINVDAGAEKRGSVGKVLPAYQIRMRDIGQGEQRAAIEIAGKGIIDAYYDPWQSRDQLMPDGWFVTGDVGRLDADGYLYIVGRTKEVISVAGAKFFPQEVEDVLLLHPDVGEACVFPDEDARWGEVPGAAIVPRDPAHLPAESALREHCMQHLAPFKIPHRFLFVNALARTASGKPIRERSRMMR